ncbi:zinc finger, BED-type, Zinc finger, C2H2, WD40/YVTN repeat-like-containing domain protein [Artemisia annua]|uniref:Zinc finger, BED-type, Zinc finger, C2H2, WD40/YVTN repeat-like-containing domain protein n=1 Tax=Artemisia annua TaxID=35608 RepID=A0A2U1PXG8_ARTAN|nr:zinc finger, BED-type, Zinc finger, C2H2, WD40/YVTN repeat-like-containing domain protein [Artemisia annua]
MTESITGDFPEVIEACLDHGIMKCIAFNRRGTLLAAGCSDGNCVIWDFQTRGIAKELKDKDCVAAVTSVCWSKSGHHILVSAADNSLTLWNVAKGEKAFQTTLQQTSLQAHLHPNNGSSPPSLCLVSPFSSAPFILDFRTNITTVLPTSFPDSGTHHSNGNAHYTPTPACFNKSGDLVYLGNSAGEILIIDHQHNRVCGIFTISGGAVIKNIVFSRNGKYLLTNSSDRTIRIYENLLPVKDSLKTLDNDVSEIKKLKGVGLKRLSIFREFQDSVTKVHWKAPCFSGNSEWVVGGSASNGEHKIYIWDRVGNLANMLEGPTEALVDLAWHPVRPILVSVSLTGLAYIWVKDDTEEWSAFAPDFRELDENEEYVEQEDEFDLMPGTEKEELLYLPAHPSPDVREKLPESDNAGSPLSHNSNEEEIEEPPESNKSGSPCSHDSSETESEKLPEINKYGSPHSQHSSEDEVDKLPIANNSGSLVVHDWSENEMVMPLRSFKFRSPHVNISSEIEGGTHSKKRRKRSKKLSDLHDFTGDCSNMEIVSTLDVDEPVTQFKKSVSPNQGKLRSKVWRHFKKHFKPNNEAVAICNYCSRSFSGGVTAGTSHLRNHVERKHAQFVFPEVHNHMDSTSTPNGDSTSSDWDHYKKFKKPNNDIVGVCDFCSKNIVVRDGETYKLKNHLKRKHLKLIKSIASSKTESVSILKLEEPMTEVEESSPPSQGKNKVIMDWAHFQKVENSNNKIVAVCKHCSKNLVLGDDESTKLRNHLNRKHAELVSSIDCIKTEDVSIPDIDEPMAEVEEVDPSSQRSLDVDESMAMTVVEEVNHPPSQRKKSMVWNHFEKVKKPDNKIVAVCNYCSATFLAGAAGTSNLRNHLKRKHEELIVTPASWTFLCSK